MHILHIPRNITAAFILLAAFSGCGSQPVRPNPTPMPATPSESFTDKLPVFELDPNNEVKISGRMSDLSPAFIIGSLVTTTGKLDVQSNFLKNAVKPIVTPLSETPLHCLIENSVDSKDDWLNFVNINISSSTCAELTVAKVSKVMVDGPTAIDWIKLRKSIKDSHSSNLANLNIIIGYTDYLITARYYRNVTAGAAVSAYCVNISGNWYSKFEDSIAYHRIVAFVSPALSFLESLRTPVTTNKFTVSVKLETDFDKAISEAMEEVKRNPRKFTSPLVIK